VRYQIFYITLHCAAGYNLHVNHNLIAKRKHACLTWQSCTFYMLSPRSHLNRSVSRFEMQFSKFIYNFIHRKVAKHR